MLETPGNICVFNENNYKVSISVSFSSLKICTIQSIFHTGAGPKLVSKNLLEIDGLQTIRTVTESSLRYVSDKKISIVETFLLYVRMGDGCIRVVFQDVRKLAVSNLLGASSSTNLSKDYIQRKTVLCFGTPRRY